MTETRRIDPAPEPRPGTPWAELPTPALLLDEEVLERNLAHMAARARHLGVALRPHVKTHKCTPIARVQRRHGAAGLTVSTLGEARQLAAAGFDDLTWAFPLILNRLPEVAALSRQVTLRLVVDSLAAVEVLEASGLEVHVWLKVDCGYHRAGIDPKTPAAHDLARRLAGSPRLVFDGLLTHAGHGYHARDRATLRQVAAEERDVLVRFAEELRAGGIPVPQVSVGSTPTMSVVDDLSGVNEIRPGNYVFYDTTQCVLGACEVADCALTVLTSVVSCRPGGRTSVVDAGALAMSKDTGPEWLRPVTYGRVLRAPGELDPELALLSLSQEHGIVNAPLTIGSRLRLVPNHSCLVVPNFATYVVVRGDEVVGSWPIWGRSERV